VALYHFLVAWLFCDEYQRYSSNDSKVRKHYSIGAVSGNISMVVHSMGISLSIGRVDSIPCMRSYDVKLEVVLTIMR
jgi:hypothetical protein